MTTLSEFDPFDIINLADFLTASQIAVARELYTLYHWDWFPPDALKWRFADVCALFFRLRRHADLFPGEESGLVLAALERAINQYQVDEIA